MAGSISLSLSQQFDELGEPLAGGKLYFYAAGTSTPQNAYQDYALTIPWPNPIILDSAGRVPSFYLADGQIKIALKSSSGVTQVTADNLLVVGASSGSGSPPSVDATTILSTGDIKVNYGTGVLTGFVRANGRTMGNASSGATERANADTANLFTWLWNADANLVVSTGRGANPAADYAANKTIALPDWRGRALAGLDDMGNSAAGRLTSTYFGTAATALGAAGGAESSSLQTANLPAYTPAGSVSVTSTVSTIVTNTGIIDSANVPGGAQGVFHDHTAVSMGSITSTGSMTGAAQGGTSAPFAAASPAMLATIYLKL